jgi:serine/threonine-protein kinase
MMSADAERYRRAQAIAHELLDLAPAERVQRADAACGDDVDLRREVEWLIEAVEISGPDGKLAGIDEFAQTLLADARIESAAPRQYRLLERIGEGGMGQVWLAERDDGDVRQRLALKMLRGAGLATDGELARFHAEGRILASLQHPNIAHLFDAGHGADGVPYLAMEYVDGERIDRWCDAHALSLPARIELFLKVCAAVEYAHAQLVIHRDLKPANILVDANSEPKLLDFGIARLIDTGADTPRATTVLRAMTLAYASPEQVEGKPLGTATDIYSLGVVLYELLAGVRPFDHLESEHARSNAIISGEITPPSRPAAARHERTEPSTPARRIPADVDAIVLKALRREPELRYASVGELADDLRNFLGARPVHARRGQWGYRSQRFVWRNRWPLAAAAILVATAAGFTWRTVLAEREARLQAATSDQVSEFLVSVFAASDANLSDAARHDLSARAVLDNGAARIEKELADQPRIRARLLEAVGNAYRHMYDNPKAARLLREAADLNLSPAVDQPAAAARCLEALANTLANGQFPAAEIERAARDSLGLAERLSAPGSQEIANAWMVLSLALNRSGNRAAAQQAAEMSLAMNRAHAGQPDNRLSAAHHNLCMITSNRGDQATAKSYCETTLALFGENPTSGKMMTLALYARAFERSGDYPRAMQIMAEVLENTRMLEGDGSPFFLTYLDDYVRILDHASRYDEAAQQLQKLDAGMLHLYGKDSGEYSLVLVGRGRHHALLGEYERALPSLREALQFRSKRYDAQDPRVLSVSILLAMALVDAGDAGNEAQALIEAAVAGWATKDEPHAVDAAVVPVALAQWQVARGEFAAAERTLDAVEAPTSLRDLWLDSRADLLRAAIARHRGDTDGVLRAEQRAWQRLRDRVGAEHPQAARHGLLLARDLRAAGRNTEARELEAQLRPVFERSFPPDSAFRRALDASP